MNKTRFVQGMVSVVIPAYNCAAYITECIESVISQTYKHLEIIVIDDGSTDATDAVVKRLQKSYPCIRYRKIPNSKSPTARNLGIDLAVGEFIAVIDSDDIWPLNKLELQVAASRAHPNAIILGDIQSFYMDGHRQIWGEITRLPEQKVGAGYADCILRLDLNQMVLFNTLLAPAEILKKDGMWNPSFITAHDWENWIRLAKKYEFIHLDSVLQFYRKHPSSTTKKHKKCQALHYQLMAINRHTRDSLGGWLSAFAYRRLRYENWIRVYLYEQDISVAYKLLIRAIFTTNMLFSFSGLITVKEAISGLLRRVTKRRKRCPS